MEAKNKIWTVVAIIIIAVLAVAAIFYFGRNKNKEENSPSPNPSAVVTIPPEELNFSKTGNLAKQKNEVGDDAWFLIYEEPGKPALKAELVFDEESVCEVGGQKKDCVAGEFKEGEWVKIDGLEIEGMVLVSTLTSVEASSAAVGVQVGMANPASVYCEENGGALEIKTDDGGGQYGVCKFSNGKECEEWAFFRGTCSK